jgi:hypothetical protein
LQQNLWNNSASVIPVSAILSQRRSCDR